MSSSIPAPLSPNNQTFTVFPELPPELRIKIWRYALPGTRVLKMKARDDPTRPRSIDAHSHLSSRTTVLRATNPMEGLQLLHVSRESHDVVDKVFDILPAAENARYLRLQYPLYLHSAVDMLYFDNLPDFVSFVGKVGCFALKDHHIQRVAIAIYTESRFLPPHTKSTHWSVIDIAHSVLALVLKECVLVKKPSDLPFDRSGDFLSRLIAYGKSLRQEDEERDLEELA